MVPFAWRGVCGMARLCSRRLTQAPEPEHASTSSATGGSPGTSQPPLATGCSASSPLPIRPYIPTSGQLARGEALQVSSPISRAEAMDMGDVWAGGGGFLLACKGGSVVGDGALGLALGAPGAVGLRLRVHRRGGHRRRRRQQPHCHRHRSRLSTAFFFQCAAHSSRDGFWVA